MKFPITKDFDWRLFLAWFLLVSFGVVAIFSASTTKIDEELTRADYYWKQMLFALLSLVVMFVILRTPATIIDVFVVPSYFITLFLLVLVFFMPPVNNSYRWINIGGITIQPSEIAKIVLILLNAKVLAHRNITSFEMLVRPLLYLAIPFVLILREPDLGTSLLLLVSYYVMLAQAGFPPIFLLLIISPFISMLTSFFNPAPLLFGIISPKIVTIGSYINPAFILFAALLVFLLIKQRFTTHIIIFIIVINTFFLFITPVLWNSLKPYQQNRILTFIDPSRDPLNTGYQVIQAKIAVGSGRIFGKGFLEGTQKNMNFLPEHHTDFIFSVISEELGFVGSTLLLLLFLFFFLRLINCIFRSEVKERRIAMSGILAFLGFQVLVNVGMNIGLMPTTGVPLPFISYGGSSLLVNSISVALVLKYSQEKDV